MPVRASVIGSGTTTNCVICPETSPAPKLADCGTTLRCTDNAGSNAPSRE